MSWRSIASAGLILVAALISYYVLSLALFADAMGCRQSVLERNQDPSGSRVMVIARFDCGAVTNDAIGVFLVAEPGTSELVPAEAIFSADAAATFRTDWVSPSRVRISEIRSRQVFRRLTKTADVDTEYID
jgi:hypothetical protein